MPQLDGSMFTAYGVFDATIWLPFDPTLAPATPPPPSHQPPQVVGPRRPSGPLPDSPSSPTAAEVAQDPASDDGEDDKKSDDDSDDMDFHSPTFS